MSQRIALSVKQPWATLILLGIKTIEIRKWSTERRGTVYIHTGSRPESNAPWDLVPEIYRDLAQKMGGIVGHADLVGCRTYRSAEDFAADGAFHRVDTSYFTGAPLFGFIFEKPQLTDFEPRSGTLYFFPI